MSWDCGGVGELGADEHGWLAVRYEATVRIATINEWLFPNL